MGGFASILGGVAKGVASTAKEKVMKGKGAKFAQNIMKQRKKKKSNNVSAGPIYGG